MLAIMHDLIVKVKNGEISIKTLTGKKTYSKIFEKTGEGLTPNSYDLIHDLSYALHHILHNKTQSLVTLFLTFILMKNLKFVCIAYSFVFTSSLLSITLVILISWLSGKEVVLYVDSFKINSLNLKELIKYPLISPI